MEYKLQDFNIVAGLTAFLDKGIPMILDADFFGENLVIKSPQKNHIVNAN